MNTNFNESYLADDVHYNELGAKFIADIYFNGIQSEFASSTSILKFCLLVILELKEIDLKNF